MTEFIPDNNADFKILIIEDDKNLSFLIQKKLKRIGFDVSTAYNGTEAVEEIKKFSPALILLDYRLADISGRELVEKLALENYHIPFIIMTGFGDERIAVEMMKLGAVDYLVKDQNFLEILIPVIGKAKDKIELGKKLTDTQETLKKSEIRFQTLIENSTDITIIFNTDGITTYLSPSIKPILGYSVTDLLGTNFLNIIHPEDIPMIQEKIRFITQSEKKLDVFNFRVKNTNNQYNYLEGTFNNLLQDPSIQGILSNLRDITMRMQAEEGIKRFSYAVNQSPVAIVITNIDGKIEYVNPKFCEVSGYSQQELIGANPSILKSGRHPADFYKRMWDTISSGKEWRGEVQNKSKNGEYFWESVSISPIFDNKNKITQFIAIKEDITDKKKNEEKLKKANEFYLALFEDSPAMIWRSRKDGSRDYFNKTWLRFRGSSIEEELDGSWIESIHNDDKENYIESVSRALQHREPVKNIFRLRRYNDEYRWINEICKPYYDIDGYFAGMIGTGIDITENKLAEEAMRKAKDEAEKSEALKTEFLAQMSHEIRTPINAILSFTSLLRYELEDKVDEDLKESFRIIDKGGRRLIRTIDLLLHMSEMQTGNYQINMKDFDLYKDIIENVVLELSNIASLRNIDIIIERELKETMIYADEHSIMQIFENLVDNAIKYNKDEGKIFVRVTDSGNNHISVEIEDTGIGMSEEFIPKLFSPFKQEESGYTRKFEGNGLGLALVKKYCEINGAEIEVKSEKGKGSTFIVRLRRKI